MSRTVLHLKDDLFPVSDFRFCVIVCSEKEKSCALLLFNYPSRLYTYNGQRASGRSRFPRRDPLPFSFRSKIGRTVTKCAPKRAQSWTTNLKAIHRWCTTICAISAAPSGRRERERGVDTRLANGSPARSY